MFPNKEWSCRPNGPLVVLSSCLAVLCSIPLLLSGALTLVACYELSFEILEYEKSANERLHKYA